MDLEIKNAKKTYVTDPKEWYPVSTWPSNMIQSAIDFIKVIEDIVCRVKMSRVKQLTFKTIVAIQICCNIKELYLPQWTMKWS